MEINMVLLKNILMTLKRKRYDNVTNIKQVYNVWHMNKEGYKGSKNLNATVVETVG